MKALDIIQGEHRGMWRVASAMDALAQTLERPEERTASIQAIGAMLDYIDGYIDQVHHPKEDQYLFSALKRHAHGVGAVIERLEHEHRDGPRFRDELRQAVQSVAAGRSNDMPALVQSVAEFTEQLRAHIRAEEMHVMPEARKVLTAQDWQAIDAAFLDNDDPLFGARARSEFEALKARIIAITPAPVGLGGTAPAEVSAPAASEATGEIVLKLRGITSHYGRIQALHGIDLDVRQGQLVALVGANGAGKTTLLRTISGVQPASGGSIELYGQDITRMAPDKRVRQGVCQVPEGRQVFGPMSIEDNMRLGAYTRRDSEIDQDMERMYSIFPVLKEKRMLPAGTVRTPWLKRTRAHCCTSSPPSRSGVK